MALRSSSSTPRRDLGNRDSPPADSPSPTSQGGSGNEAKADVARMTEVEHLLADLEKQGVEINDKIASIIDDEVARIKAEAERENTKRPKMNMRLLLDGAAAVALGLIMWVEFYELHVALSKKVLLAILFGNKK
ncbi:unnamed protein product [Urochloa decumbens]|uniref:Uncharacterized protein n=1 Tax=Urochloa decumbens TaxID=240449 RepID=A0ABC9CXS0_9POAL